MVDVASTGSDAVDARSRQALADPPARPRVVIDTDAANEIDDQFVLAWALGVPDRIDLQAVHAAPFSFAHRRAAQPQRVFADQRPFAPPDEGMRRSHDEILRVFGHCGVPAEGRVFAGSAGYLPAHGRPLDSDAARDLVARAHATPPGERSQISPTPGLAFSTRSSRAGICMSMAPSASSTCLSARFFTVNRMSG